MGFPNSSQWTMAPVAEAKGFRDGPRGRNSSPRLCNVARCMKQCFLRSTCIRNVRSVNDSRASLFACPRKTSVTETRSNRLTFSSFASRISSNVAIHFVDRCRGRRMSDFTQKRVEKIRFVDHSRAREHTVRKIRNGMALSLCLPIGLVFIPN